jgi:hypothetical protein
MVTGRFHDVSILSQPALMRIGGVMIVLALLWLAVAWAVAVP